MRYVGIALASVVVVVLVAFWFFSGEPVRFWSNAKNRHLAEARFVRVEGNEVVLQPVAGGEMRVALNELSIDDRKYLASNAGLPFPTVDEVPSPAVVSLPPVAPHPSAVAAPSSVSRQPSPNTGTPAVPSENLPPISLPGAARSLVIVAVDVGNQSYFLPALVAESIDADTVLIRADNVGLQWQPAEYAGASCSILVPQAEGSTRRVAATFIGFAEPDGAILLRAAASEVPPPILEESPLPAVSGAKYKRYGFLLQRRGAHIGWRIVEGSGPAVVESNKQSSRAEPRVLYKHEAGDKAMGTAVVIGEDGGYFGLCRAAYLQSTIGDDGRVAVGQDVVRVTLRPSLRPDENSGAAYDLGLHAGREPGTADFTFMWHDPIPNGEVPRLVVDCRPTGPELAGSRSFAIKTSGLSVFQGVLTAQNATTVVLECVEITDDAEFESLFRGFGPRRSPTNRPMKARFRYNPAEVGRDMWFQVGVVKYDPVKNTYVGEGTAAPTRGLDFNSRSSTTIKVLPSRR